jgi:aminopeptidase N
VRDDARAFDLFDSITYTKGEAFLHMLEAFLGETAFREGVRRYMRAHRLSNTTTADLWHHLAQASGRDVRAFAAPWVEQPGFPRLDVTQHCEGGRGVVRLEQRRFTLNDPQAQPLSWPVPITLLIGGNQRRSTLLEASPSELRLDDCGVVHVASGGYFRVRYDSAAANAIAQKFANLAAPERQRLLADTFALVQSGEVDLADYLRLLEAMSGESDRFVLTQAVESLTFLRNLLDTPADRTAFDRRTMRLLREPLGRIGWSARPGEDSEWPVLRSVLIRALGLAGDPGVLRHARALFAARAVTPMDPAIRGAVLDVVGRHADATTFDRLLELLREATAVERRWEFQSALRHVADSRLRQRWWGLLLGDELPPGEAMYNLRNAGASSDGPEAAWQFLLGNLEKAYAKASPRGRAYLLPEAAVSFSDASRADELMRLTRQHLDAGALYQAEKAADVIWLAAAVKVRQGKALLDWVAARGGE